MDYSYIFRSAVPDYGTFAEFGFEKQDDRYLCKKPLADTDFSALITVLGERITVEVYEKAAEEGSADTKYALFDVKSANGAFVAGIRAQVQEVMHDFRECCFESGDLQEKYISHIEREFSCKAEYPWAAPQEVQDAKRRYTDASVFRCPNQKWFALVMNISYKNLGLESDEGVSVVNLKADPDKIPELTDRKSVFPAWHMNKKHWITVLLTRVTDFERLCELTRRSYELAGGNRLFGCVQNGCSGVS